jgi:hypothetical protein
MPMPPDRDPFNPPLHAAIATSRELYIAAEDNLTHHLDAKDGRSVSRCGSGTRLSRDWALVSCPACRATPEPAKVTSVALIAAAAPAPMTPPGCYPVSYRFTIRGKVHTVIGHQEIGYGQVGHTIDCDGVTYWVATEYIRDNGTKA